MASTTSLAPFFGELAARPLFVVFELRARTDGRAGSDKIPVGPFTQPIAWLPIDAHNPAERMPLAQAEWWVAQLGARYGVGYVLTPEVPTFFLDLDHCRTPDGWADYVAPILATFPGCFVECSSSGDGIHVLGTYAGPRPLHGTRCKELRAELYTAGRFCALTGSHGAGAVATDGTAGLYALLPRFPPRDDVPDDWTDGPQPDARPITDDAQLIERALRSNSARVAFGGGVSFADLWLCNVDKLAAAFPSQTPGNAYDGSAADLALANALMFWTGNDCERTARLLRTSGLARPKHDREDYLRSTVLRARQPSVYSDTRAPVVGMPPAAPPPGPVANGVGVMTQPLAPAAGTPPPPPAPTDSYVPIALGRDGRFDATLPNLEYALTHQHGGRLGFDTFRDRIMAAPAGTDEWRPITDDDMISLRNTLEKIHRYKPINDKLMLHALRLVARRHSFDSAQVWLSGLQWDGVPRVDTFLSVYAGAVDDEYTRAVSRYIWTGLANRVLVPGCQLDMAVAFVSPQGRHKSTGLRELVPDPEYFNDSVSFLGSGDDFKRLIRGKLVVEIAELAGLSRAELEHVKAMITRRVEEWVEKWQTQPSTFARRCMLFATTNDERFLPPDETGNRRWLPVNITVLDRGAIARDRAQLWAEGAALYNRRCAELGPVDGQAWRDAERLASGRHAQYEARDVWLETIQHWLESPTPPPTPGQPPGPPPGTGPLAVSDVLRYALGMKADQMNAVNEKRVARSLRQLGYIVKVERLNGKLARVWRANGTVDHHFPQ